MYQMQNIIQRLPDVNRETLRRVIAHLRRYEQLTSVELNISCISHTLVT